MTAQELLQMLEANAQKKPIVLRTLNIKKLLFSMLALGIGITLVSLLISKMNSLWPQADATLTAESLTNGLFFVFLLGCVLVIVGMLIPCLMAILQIRTDVPAAARVAQVFYPEQDGILTTRTYILRNVCAAYLNNAFYSPEHKQAYVQYAADVLTRLEQEHVVKNLQIEDVFEKSLRTMELEFQGIPLVIKAKSYEYKSVA